MKKNDKKKPVKQGKKTFKLNKSSSSSNDSKKMRVAVGVGAALLGLAYIQTISPMLRKKKIEAEQAKLQSQINETVRGRIAEKAESVKAKALQAVADIKVLAESYSTGVSRSTTPKTSPTVKVPTILQKSPLRIFKNIPEKTYSPRTSNNIVPKTSPTAKVLMVLPNSPVRVFKKVPEEIKKQYAATKNDDISASMKILENAIALAEQVKSPLKTKLSKEQDKLAEDISEKLLEAIEYEFGSNIGSSPRASDSSRSRTSISSLRN